MTFLAAVPLSKENHFFWWLYGTFCLISTSSVFKSVHHHFLPAVQWKEVRQRHHRRRRRVAVPRRGVMLALSYPDAPVAGARQQEEKTHENGFREKRAGTRSAGGASGWLHHAERFQRVGRVAI